MKQAYAYKCATFETYMSCFLVFKLMLYILAGFFLLAAHGTQYRQMRCYAGFHKTMQTRQGVVRNIHMGHLSILCTEYGIINIDKSIVRQTGIAYGFAMLRLQQVGLGCLAVSSHINHSYLQNCSTESNAVFCIMF